MKKVVVLGPESTGKSTLCAQLAAYFNTLWVPEFARSYLEEKGPLYTYDDLLVIAQQQQKLEDAYADQLRETVNERQQHSLLPDASSGPMLLVDTNQYVMKVWCEVVFGKCHSWILDTAASTNVDLYLLTDIDLPWTPDPLREHPDPVQRRKHFLMYKDILVNDGTPWVLISGTGNHRFQTAVDAISKLFQ